MLVSVLFNILGMYCTWVPYSFPSEVPAGTVPALSHEFGQGREVYLFYTLTTPVGCEDVTHFMLQTVSAE